MSSEPSSPWYSKGLRFSCTQCGNCCSGKAGWVWFDEEDGRKIAGRLGIDIEKFYRDYARNQNGAWSLREKRTEHGYDCILLDRESTPGRALCSAYEDRPKQCRTWPFWLTNIRSQKNWEETKNSTPCPGMDSGDLVTLDSIRNKLDT